jgi:hypothetical protein
VLEALPPGTVAAVPRWEPETVSRMHHPLKTGGRGFERAVQASGMLRNTKEVLRSFATH